MRIATKDSYGVFSLSRDRDINVTITTKTRNNGTLYVHVFVVPSERGRGREDPFVADWRVHQMGELTTYAVPRAATFQLVSEKPEDVCSLCYSVFSSTMLLDSVACLTVNHEVSRGSSPPRVEILSKLTQM